MPPTRQPGESDGESDLPGLRQLLGGLDRTGGIGMGRQFIPVGMGMGIVPGCKCRFLDRMVRRVGQRVGHGMVPGILQLTFPVLARVRFMM